MENQYKTNMDREGMESNVKVVSNSNAVIRYSDIMLRILGLFLTLIAAVVEGVDKQTKIVSITIVPTLPPVSVPVTAKWQYLSAFVYLLVSNVIACSYATASLGYCVGVATQKLKNKATLVLIILDLLIMGLLLSATGAAMAVGLIGAKGNSHVQWNKVCNVFDGFCHHFAASIVLTLLGSLVFLLLVVLAILNLHKRSR